MRKNEPAAEILDLLDGYLKAKALGGAIEVENQLNLFRLGGVPRVVCSVLQEAQTFDPLLNIVHRHSYMPVRPLSEGGNTMARPIFLDTCALKHRATFMWYAYGSARSAILTESVSSEIFKLSISSDPKKREAAAQAALTIHKLGRLPTVKLVRDRKPPLADHVDDDLLLRAKMTRGRILTADRDFQDIARKSGVAVIEVQDLCRRFEAIAPDMALEFPAPRFPEVSDLPMIARGEVLKVAIVEQGTSAHQGVAYLDDGRKVIVSNGISYMGLEIDVIVRNVHPTSSGELIFTTPATLGNGNGHAPSSL